MMEAAKTSETLVTSTRLHDTTTQKTAIFVLTAMRNSDPIFAFSNIVGFFLLVAIMKG
jgi:hypothetical protein